MMTAAKAGMPETAGIAVGVDRLVMLAADTANVSETLFFPGKELFDL
jgi:lysyl-tRNA synthetase class II